MSYLETSSETASKKYLLRRGFFVGVKWEGPRWLESTVGEVPRFTYVTDVHLVGSQYCDRDVEKCASFSRLEAVVFDGLFLTADILERFHKIRTLRSVAIHDGTINVATLEKLAAFPALNSLSIKHAVIEPIASRSFFLNRNVESLYLTEMDLSAVDLDTLDECHRLTYLNCENSILSNSILQHIGKVGTLEMIVVSGTNLTADQIDFLHERLPKLIIVGQPRETRPQRMNQL